MKIPTLAPSLKVSNKDGTIHEDLLNLFTQLLSTMQANLSDEGYVLPPLNSTQITQISGTKTIQRVIWNSTTGKAMVNNNGTFQTINVT